MSSREHILHRIRAAIAQHQPLEYEPVDRAATVYVQPSGELYAYFKQKFAETGGILFECPPEDLAETFRFFKQKHDYDRIYCPERELSDQLEQPAMQGGASAVKEAEVGVSSVTALIARTGSLLMATGRTKSRLSSLFPPVHAAVAYRSQIVQDLRDGYNILMSGKNGFGSTASLITGPSRTADIEKTLVMGAHGPRELYLFLVDDNRPVPPQTEPTDDPDDYLD